MNLHQGSGVGGRGRSRDQSSPAPEDLRDGAGGGVWPRIGGSLVIVGDIITVVVCSSAGVENCLPQNSRALGSAMSQSRNGKRGFAKKKNMKRVMVRDGICGE